MSKPTSQLSKYTPIVVRYEELEHPVIHVDEGILPDRPFDCIWVGSYGADKALVIAPAKEGDIWCVYMVDWAEGRRYAAYNIESRYCITTIAETYETDAAEIENPKEGGKKRLQTFEAVFKNAPDARFVLHAPTDSEFLKDLRNEASVGHLDPESFMMDYETLFKKIAFERPRLGSKILGNARKLANKHSAIKDNHRLFDYLACTTYTDVMKENHDSSIRLLNIFLALERDESASSSCWKYTVEQAVYPGDRLREQMPNIIQRYEEKFGHSDEVTTYLNLRDEKNPKNKHS